MGLAGGGGYWQPLECVVVVKEGRACVKPVGELDLASVPVLAEHLREALGQEPAELELDLSGLTFMDSSGLHLVLQWHRTMAETGVGFSVSGATGTVRRLFAITGVDTVLPLEPDRQQTGK